MRLKNVESGHGPFSRMKLAVMGWILGMEAPDVVKASLYRPGFFGLPFHRTLQIALRGSPRWTAGECELFAALTSRFNACRF